MSGRELILPATVLSSHLESCAAGLAADPGPPDDLAQVVGQLVSGQRHIAATLDRLAAQLDIPSDTAPTADRAALGEVLRAAARASGHAADALAEGEHLFE